MRIEILDEAELDILDGRNFYEGQSEGLGARFVDSILADIESLEMFAGIHAQYFGYHRMIAHRFPFAIYYRFDGKTARVYAVLDCRRDPTWRRHRLAPPNG